MQLSSSSGLYDISTAALVLPPSPHAPLVAHHHLVDTRQHHLLVLHWKPAGLVDPLLDQQQGGAAVDVDLHLLAAWQVAGEELDLRGDGGGGVGVGGVDGALGEDWVERWG